jgi:uncharacterized protein (DUF433 family)
MTRTVQDHIEVTPGVAGGRPRVAGHRIRVQDVVIWHESLGLSPDEIVSAHPGLSLADVYAAPAYNHDHRDAIRQAIEYDDAVEAAVRQHAPSKLARRLATGGDDAPVSSR